MKEKTFEWHGVWSPSSDGGAFSPLCRPQSFVIYYAFLRLVAVLTARGVLREQIGIFTSESRWCVPPHLHLAYAIVTLPSARGFESSHTFISILFYYRRSRLPLPSPFTSRGGSPASRRRRDAELARRDGEESETRRRREGLSVYSRRIES